MVPVRSKVDLPELGNHVAGSADDAELSMIPTTTILGSVIVANPT